MEPDKKRHQPGLKKPTATPYPNRGNPDIVGANFTPHVLAIKAGENVMTKIMSYIEQQGSLLGFSILSANGYISTVTLGQSTPLGKTQTYEGSYEILSLTGLFMDCGGIRSRVGAMSVSLVDQEGRVCGGVLSGLFIAGTSVQVLLGIFTVEPQQSLALASLLLEERVKRLLCEGAPLLRYNVLKDYVKEYPEEQFLEVLQKHACLVQGLWTAKSELLKIDQPLGRNYVLSLFSKDRTIENDKVEEAGFIAVELTKYLEVFSENSFICDGWVFKEPTDHAFIQSHSRIVEEQNTYWKDVSETIEVLIGKNLNLWDEIENPPKKMHEDVRNILLPVALKNVFKTTKVCTYGTICRRLRELPYTEPSTDAWRVARLPISNKKEFKKILKELATNIHGSYVLTSSLQFPELDLVRNLVIGLFLKNEPGAELTKDVIYESCRHDLCWEIKNTEYDNVMQDLCEAHGQGWVIGTPV